MLCWQFQFEASISLLIHVSDRPMQEVMSTNVVQNLEFTWKNKYSFISLFEVYFGHIQGGHLFLNSFHRHCSQPK